MTLTTKDFYYDLPPELIAQTPVSPRDHSRLLVYENGKPCEHRHFYDLPRYLKKGDVLVVNETKVLPARLYGRTANGGAMEFLLLKRRSATDWEVLVKPGKKARTGATITFAPNLSAQVLDVTPEGGRIVRFAFEGVFEQILDELGNMPLPPYITQQLQDKSRYQTVYARQEGSAAAPTAGLHFTPELLSAIREMGVEIVPVLLHVGLGTFRPVKEREIERHHMHSEYYEVTPEAAQAVNACKERGGRVICVGTTSVRTLESAAENGRLAAKSGDTEIFITPGYQFQVVNGLITNFHLPESTLLMLVAALIGLEATKDLYRAAVAERYRFFSFGDAMLLI